MVVLYSYHNPCGLCLLVRVYLCVCGSEEYKQDTFGLKTLHTSGRLTFVTEENVQHRDWLHTRSLYDRDMEPYLS